MFYFFASPWFKYTGVSRKYVFSSYTSICSCQTLCLCNQISSTLFNKSPWREKSQSITGSTEWKNSCHSRRGREGNWGVEIKIEEWTSRVQWVRIRLPMQGTEAPSLERGELKTLCQRGNPEPQWAAITEHVRSRALASNMLLNMLLFPRESPWNKEDPAEPNGLMN